MSHDIEIHDPPLEGLLDVKVHGYMAAQDRYVINANGTTLEVPASMVTVQPEDYSGYEDYDYDPWADYDSPADYLEDE